MAKQYLNSDEAAKHLRLSRRKVQVLCREQEMRCTKHQGEWRITLPAIEAYLQRNEPSWIDRIEFFVYRVRLIPIVRFSLIVLMVLGGVDTILGITTNWLSLWERFSGEPTNISNIYVFPQATSPTSTPSYNGIQYMIKDFESRAVRFEPGYYYPWRVHCDYFMQIENIGTQEDTIERIAAYVGDNETNTQFESLNKPNMIFDPHEPLAGLYSMEATFFRYEYYDARPFEELKPLNMGYKIQPGEILDILITLSFDTDFSILTEQDNGFVYSESRPLFASFMVMNPQVDFVISDLNRKATCTYLYGYPE